MIWPFISNKKDPELLIKELETHDVQARQDAFHQLIDHPDSKTDQLVLAALEAFNESPKDVILPLIEVAGQRKITEALPIFKALLKEKDSQLRESALQALVAIPTQESLDIMISCLNDSDPMIKQKVQNAITEVFGKDALGALIRALPIDRNSSMYFEIVSLMEHLDLFSVIKENFDQPDPMIKDFYFDTLTNFNRPDFIPLYLDFYPEASQPRREKITEILLDYPPLELLPFFHAQLQTSGFEGLAPLCDRALIDRFSQAKEEILSFILALNDTRYRLRVLPGLIKQLDPYCFNAALEILKEGSSEIRTLTLNALSALIKRTYERMNDKAEPNRSTLAAFYDAWEKQIVAMMREREMSDEFRKLVRRLFYALTQNRHALIRPFIKELFQKNFHETYFFLKEWEFDEQFGLFHWMVNEDPSFGSLILTALNGNVDDNLWRVALKLPESFADIEDREFFKRNLITRNRNTSIDKFLKDSDHGVRAAALEFASESRVNGLIDLLKSATKDPSPLVRKTALHCLNQQHFPQIQNFLVEALGDPDESIIFYAMTQLKQMLPAPKFAPLLVRFVNSISDKLRNYALGEIAQLTKERYMANFNNLTPEVRKLAGKAIQKIDQGFSDQIIQDLYSLDPQTRLQAALLLENIKVDNKGRDALLAAMKDPSKLVRAAVVKTLGVIGDQNLIKNLISFFNDPDPRVRANTIEAISTLGDRQAIQILLPYLEDSNNRIRANAIVGIRKIGNLNVMPILQKMLAHRDAGMKASAIWAMGEINDQNFLSFLYPYFADRDDTIRFNAIRAVARIAPQTLSQYMPMLRKDPSPQIKKLVSDLSYKVI